MRSLTNSLSPQKTKNSINSRAERRRKLRRRGLAEQLVNCWRLILLTTISISLSGVLVDQGWKKINSKQIIVQGSKNIKAESFLKVAGDSFFKPLLSLDPIELEKILSTELPVESVVVKRKIFPLGLEISVQEIKPIAYATRRTPRGIEEGMLDKFGQWIPSRIASKGAKPSSELIVEGWMENERKRIVRLFEQRVLLESSLEKIILSPNGDLSLLTKDLGLVNLGSSRDHFDKQLKAIDHLSLLLPKSFFSKPGMMIDLTDPSKPELQMPNSGA